MTWRPLVRRPQLASTGLAFIAIFVLSLLALHVTSLGHEPPHMSQFANSRFGLFWTLAVYCFVAGTSLLVWALRPCLRDGPAKRAGVGLLSFASVGGLLVAIFRSDAVYPVTLHGTIHEDAAMAMFVLLGAAMVVLVPAFRDSPDWGGFSRVSLVLGVVVTATWIAYLVTSLQHLPVRGPVQRVLVGLIVAWFTALALRLRRTGEVAVPEPAASSAEPRPTLRKVATRARARTRHPTSQ